MSVAAETREAVREHPFLLTALRAGVVNYRGAAEFLDVEGDSDAVATALRRFAGDLPEYATAGRDVRVRMERGVGLTSDTDDAEGLLRVGGHAVRPDAGSMTAIVATGETDPRGLGAALGRLHAVDVPVEAAGVAGDALVVVVSRRAGPRAVQVLEDTLATVPEPGIGSAADTDSPTG